MQQSCSRARIRVTCARVPARRSAKRAGRAGGWDPIQRARRFMTRATLPFGIPLIPLNPAESRIAFKFCPSWKAEPDRDTAEKCGLVSCSRSFYPCARRPQYVMAGHARTRSGYPAIHVLSSVRRAWWLEMPGTSPRAILPVGIPLIPLNPAESRIRFKFCPSWRAEPDRDTAEKCGLVSCSRSSYPCARRPRHVMAGHARTRSGYPAIRVLSSVPAGLAAGDARNKSGHDGVWEWSVGETAHRPDNMQTNFGNTTLRVRAEGGFVQQHHLLGQYRRADLACESP